MTLHVKKKDAKRFWKGKERVNFSFYHTVKEPCF